MPKQVDTEVLFRFFSHYGEMLDELSEAISELYDEGRRSLPPDVQEWHRLTGRMIVEYDIERYPREADKAAAAANARRSITGSITSREPGE